MSNAQLGAQPFGQPEDLPLRSIESIWAARVVAVAPHPDDECLGCGGAIALLKQKTCDLRVLVMTNGTMSHPNSRQFPMAALQALRESETRAAMKTLGVEPEAIAFLGLPDGAVPTTGEAFKLAVMQCCDYLSEAQPQLILLPWRSDPHPDHRASWGLINAALRQLQLSPRRLEYPIWDWDIAQRGSIPENITGWRLDISRVVKQKQQAILLYRSQTSNLIDDDPDGFRLSQQMIDQLSQPWELYFEEMP
jgi:LmbE family N-acetylglucosaminyl deacetylase